MGKVITDIEQVTPERLTEILHSNGHLDRGEVTKISYVSENSNHFIKVEFSSNAIDSAPSRLFLKITKHEALPENDREVHFYNVVVPAMPDSPVVQCYDAAYNPETRYIQKLWMRK